MGVTNSWAEALVNPCVEMWVGCEQERCGSCMIYAQFYLQKWIAIKNILIWRLISPTYFVLFSPPFQNKIFRGFWLIPDASVVVRTCVTIIPLAGNSTKVSCLVSSFKRRPERKTTVSHCFLCCTNWLHTQDCLVTNCTYHGYEGAFRAHWM